MVDTKLNVSRELYTDKKGREYFIYFVKGKIRGRDFGASMQPDDPGGYELLEAVFDKQESVPLAYEMVERVVNYSTGEKTSSPRYYAHSVDEDGVTLDCIIKPRESSDRQILAHLLAQTGVLIN